MQHFPEHKHTLDMLCRRSESFLSLCEDFSDCVRAMEYWCTSPADFENAPAFCEEYKALYENLREEIAKWLAEYLKRG
jgi:hypothetical protein